ncbi:hypothetical protein [Methylotenera sp.]|uniref:hypothetical protein n=1 Tax=Methylotenera sp. TaxID=2051956 RepID=UPI0027310024|nr:hypothetical protein [Methylotenera sp.]MDP2072310.1 hypothetical protein [Methylotenera sp.]MDP3005109.1 hypothetical protein [Methylotenera sp.]
MEITIDCVLSAELSGLKTDSSLANLLAKGQVSRVDKPLETLVCEQFALQATPDYPIAAISATVDGLDVGDAYWLRADSVHLALQRDCFSLAEPGPLFVAREHAELLIVSLNQHFAQDGLAFFIGKSGAWYLRCDKTPQIKTSLPSVAIDKNIHQFLPTGDEYSKWLAVLNEVQMLLHEHPVNEARESAGEVAANSVWLSGGGAMPQLNALHHDMDLILANTVFYQGLAKLAKTPYKTLPANLDEVLQSTAQHVRLHLPQINNLDEVWFRPLFAALKSKKIKRITLNLGFYEKSLTIDISPIDTYKFWRKPKPVIDYLE